MEGHRDKVEYSPQLKLESRISRERFACTRIELRPRGEAAKNMLGLGISRPEDFWGWPPEGGSSALQGREQSRLSHCVCSAGRRLPRRFGDIKFGCAHVGLVVHQGDLLLKVLRSRDKLLDFGVSKLRNKTPMPSYDFIERLVA